MLPFQVAKRIWIDTPDTVNVYADFIFRFSCKRGGTLRISAEGSYALRLNGTQIAFERYHGYEDMQFYDEYSLDGLCADGENELLVTVHHAGRDFSACRANTPGLLLEITEEGRVLAASGEGSDARGNPYYLSGDACEHVTPQLGFSFAVDFTAENTSFSQAILSPLVPRILPRPVERLRVYPDAPTRLVAYGSFLDTLRERTAAEIMSRAELHPVSVEDAVSFPNKKGFLMESSEDGSFAILDLGEENTGILSLDIELPVDSWITLGWGEHLADGRVRTYIDGRNFAVDIRLPEGRGSYTFPHLRCGLRYLELHVYSPACTVYYAGVRPTLYPLGEHLPCPIADPLHERIYETCLRTLHLCMHEHYEDCPWREQALYTMDSRNQMLIGYRAFGEYTFARASLQLMAHSLRGDGFLELCSPGRVPVNIPVFSAIFVVQLAEYVAETGDTELARELYPVCARILRTFTDRICENGLLRRFPGAWNFYEWQSGLDGAEGEEAGERYDAPLLAFITLALDAIACISDALGKEEAARYRAVREKLVSSAEAFWDADALCYATYLSDGRLTHTCELTNALFLCAGMVPEERAALLRARLAEGSLLPITLSHSIFKYEALLADPAYVPQILSEIARKWGAMLDAGASSFWETEEGERAFSSAGSLCHGWSAVPAYLYFKIAEKLA